MSNISDVVLFISTLSQNCVPVIQLIQQYQVPINVVRLDTVQDRRRAANGEHFQVRSVPTLVVIYSDGNLQLFTGQIKVLSWLKNLLSPSSVKDIPETKVVSSESEMEVITPKPKKRSKKSEGLYGGKPKKKKKKKPPVKFSSEDSEGEVDLEFISSSGGGGEGPPPTEGLIVGPRSSKSSSKWVSVVDMAKQMEKDRTKTLGYNEKNLPVHN